MIFIHESDIQVFCSLLKVKILVALLRHADLGIGTTEDVFQHSGK